MTKTTRWLLFLVVSPACLADAWADLQEHFTASGTTGDSSSTGTDAAPTTSDGFDATPVATVTGPTDEASSSSTTQESGTTTGAPDANQPPTIELFDASFPGDLMGNPDHMSEAGRVKLQLVTSADVVKVRLYLDGVKLTDTDLTPADFPYAWDVLSAKFNGERTFKVEVEDAGGLTAEETTTLTVQLPQSGTVKCHFEDKGMGASLSLVSAVKYTPEAILVAGARDTGAGLKMTVWALDPDHCEAVLPGWPKTIANWSPEFAALPSVGTAIDIDEGGNIVVGGDLLVNGKPQGYVVLINEAGSRLWATALAPGDEVAGVAAATEQFADRVVIVGAQRTSDNPVRTDGAIWIAQASGGAVFVSGPNILAAPFAPGEQPDLKNERSERVRAVVMQPGTGYALGVGEREFRDNKFNLFSRSFTVQVHPLAGVMGTWTSPGDYFKHDAALALGVCDGEVIASGWTRDVFDPNAAPQPLTRFIEPDGTSTTRIPEADPGTKIHGIDCDREGKIVLAGTQSQGGVLEARVSTFTEPLGPRTWYETGVAGNDGAAAVACDGRGFCAVGVQRTADNKPYAVVRVFHP